MAYMAHDPRIPPVGTTITKEFRGKTLNVLVVEKGGIPRHGGYISPGRRQAPGFLYEGEIYTSLSSLASKLVGSEFNGYKFFDLEHPMHSETIPPLVPVQKPKKKKTTFVGVQPKPKKKKRPRVDVRLPPGIDARLQHYTKNYMLSRSEVVAKALDYYFRRVKKVELKVAHLKVPSTAPQAEHLGEANNLIPDLLPSTLPANGQRPSRQQRRKVGVTAGEPGRPKATLGNLGLSEEEHEARRVMLGLSKRDYANGIGAKYETYRDRTKGVTPPTVPSPEYPLVFGEPSETIPANAFWSFAS